METSATARRNQPIEHQRVPPMRHQIRIINQSEINSARSRWLGTIKARETDKQLKLVQDDCLLKIRVNKGGATQPQFLSASLERDIPHLQILTAFFPRNAGLMKQKVLDMFEDQNNSIQTEQWRVIKRDQYNSSVTLRRSIFFEALLTADLVLHCPFGMIQQKKENSSASRGFYTPI